MMARGPPKMRLKESEPKERKESHVLRIGMLNAS